MVVLASLLSVSVAVAASASSPLLSGYGGPGAGEQAIVGSTLLNGRSGGAGSGGPPGQGGPVSGSAANAPVNNETLALPGGSKGHAVKSQGAVTAQGHPVGGSHSVEPGAGGSDSRGASTQLYPSSLRSASSGSAALGITGGDLLLLLVAAATLASIGALTIKLVRLQA
jgi:hypothetical protein